MDHKTLEELRWRAVAAVLRGHSPEVVIDILGLRRSCIYEWLALYKRGGWEALRARPVPGRPAELDAAGKDWVKGTVLQTTPEDWGYDTALWTRGLVAQLIAEQLQVAVSGQTAGRYLHELGLSPQVPLWKAREQDPATVRRFLEEKFPRITRLAKKTGAEIFFLDEAGCRSSEHRGRTWSLVGQRPLLPSTGQRFGLNMLSAISPAGHLRFKVVDHTITSQDVIDFLRALCKTTAYPVIVLLDRHRMHFSAAVRAFARPQRQWLKLFSLPAYSPECNPDEGVWSEIKPHGISRQSIQDKHDFKAKLFSTLHRVQKQTEKIIHFFFRTPECATLSNIVLATYGYLCP